MTCRSTTIQPNSPHSILPHEPYLHDSIVPNSAASSFLTQSCHRMPSWSCPSSSSHGATGEAVSSVHSSSSSPGCLLSSTRHHHFALLVLDFSPSSAGCLLSSSWSRHLPPPPSSTPRRAAALASTPHGARLRAGDLPRLGTGTSFASKCLSGRGGGWLSRTGAGTPVAILN